MCLRERGGVERGRVTRRERESDRERGRVTKKGRVTEREDQVEELREREREREEEEEEEEVSSDMQA